jgi:hypothetical protein
VVERISEPKMTRFRAMILDEKVMNIEKSAQEAIRAREEIRATEETEVPLVAPVQDREFPMRQDAWERVFLMIE